MSTFTPCMHLSPGVFMPLLAFLFWCRMKSGRRKFFLNTWMSPPSEERHYVQVFYRFGDGCYAHVGKNARPHIPNCSIDDHIMRSNPRLGHSALCPGNVLVLDHWAVPGWLSSFGHRKPRPLNLKCARWCFAVHSALSLGAVGFVACVKMWRHQGT